MATAPLVVGSAGAEPPAACVKYCADAEEGLISRLCENTAERLTAEISLQQSASRFLDRPVEEYGAPYCVEADHVDACDPARAFVDSAWSDVSRIAKQAQSTPGVRAGLSDVRRRLQLLSELLNGCTSSSLSAVMEAIDVEMEQLERQLEAVAHQEVYLSIALGRPLACFDVDDRFPVTDCYESVAEATQGASDERLAARFLMARPNEDAPAAPPRLYWKPARNNVIRAAWKGVAELREYRNSYAIASFKGVPHLESSTEASFRADRRAVQRMLNLARAFAWQASQNPYLAEHAWREVGAQARRVRAKGERLVAAARKAKDEREAARDEYLAREERKDAARMRLAGVVLDVAEGAARTGAALRDEESGASIVGPRECGGTPRPDVSFEIECVGGVWGVDESFAKHTPRCNGVPEPESTVAWICTADGWGNRANTSLKGVPVDPSPFEPELERRREALRVAMEDPGGC